MSYERVMNGPDQKYVQEAISVWSNLKKQLLWLCVQCTCDDPPTVSINQQFTKIY